MKIIWFQVWFPKRDTDNSYKMCGRTWVSLYNSPGLGPGHDNDPNCELKLGSRQGELS